MKLFHGTPNLSKLLTVGFVQPSTKPEPLPDLTATLGAFRKLMKKLIPRLEAGMTWRDVDPGAWHDWEDAAVTPMHGFAYVTTDVRIAKRYASAKYRGTEPGVVEVELAPNAVMLPDEDWLGCIAAYKLSDCADCDADIQGDEAAHEYWATQLPALLSKSLLRQIATALPFIEQEIDWDTFCTLPLNAVLGRTVIRDLLRRGTGRAGRVAWLQEALEYTDRFAHRGPLRIVGVVS